MERQLSKREGEEERERERGGGGGSDDKSLVMKCGFSLCPATWCSCRSVANTSRTLHAAHAQCSAVNSLPKKTLK
jgi:hypothetical protein